MTARSVGVQVPSFIEENLQREYKAIRWAKKPKPDEEPRLDRLLRLKARIDFLRKRILQATGWLDKVSSLTEADRHKWKKERGLARQELLAISELYWTLNISDEEERARKRLQEYLNYKEKEAKLLAAWIPGSSESSLVDRRCLVWPFDRWAFFVLARLK